MRILQSFTDFKLDDSANVRPPAEWRLGTGLKATEKIYPKCHLTMYVEVRDLFGIPTSRLFKRFIGRALDFYEGTAGSKRLMMYIVLNSNIC